MILKPNQITMQNSINLDKFKFILNDLTSLYEEIQGEICKYIKMTYEFIIWTRLTHEVPKDIKLFFLNNCNENYDCYNEYLEDELENNYKKLILDNFINIFEISKVISLFYDSSSDIKPSYFDTIYDENNCGNDSCIYSSFIDRKYITINEFQRVRDLMTMGCLVMKQDTHEFSFPYSEYKYHICEDIDIINDTLINTYSTNKKCIYCENSDNYCFSKITSLFKYNLNDNLSLYNITPTQVMMAFMICGFKYKLDKCTKHNKINLKFEAMLVRPIMRVLDDYIGKNDKSKSLIKIMNNKNK